MGRLLRESVRAPLAATSPPVAAAQSPSADLVVRTIPAAPACHAACVPLALPGDSRNTSPRRREDRQMPCDARIAMTARIYQPAKSAMTSGEANTRRWVLEFDPAAQKQIDPLMGWTSSADMTSQVRLTFPTREAAVEYAVRNGIAYRVEEPKKRSKTIRPLGYGGNYAHNRRIAWTH
jgi:NADH dehydrogenase